MSDWADFTPLTADQFTDADRAHGSLTTIAGTSVAKDLLSDLWVGLGEHLHVTDDPDEAIARLSEFISVSRSPMALLALLERDSLMLPALLQVLSTSPAIAKLLISDPESFDLIRASDGSPAQRSVLIDELVGEIRLIQSPRRASLAIRRFAGREVLRIAYSEFVRELPPHHVQTQISHVTDAILEAALEFAVADVVSKRALPQRIDDSQPAFSIIALGNYGGQEIGYESPLDLLLLCDQIDRKNASHVEFQQKVARGLVELLESNRGPAFSFTLRFDQQPTNNESSMSDTQRLGAVPTQRNTNSTVAKDRQIDFFGIDEAATHYERNGRTWQRLAFVKARHVAGAATVSDLFLHRVEPWVYHQLLTRSEIADIRVLRRKLEKRALEATSDQRTPIANVPGGRRDIELTIQFLQLLHGGELPDVRVTGTLTAITELSRHGCLTSQEATILSTNHAKLCRLEHYLSVLFDHRISHLPEAWDVRARLAWRLGVRADDQTSGDPERFEEMLQETFAINRKIINHLMVGDPSNTNARSSRSLPAGARDDSESDGDANEVAVVTELILDPDPDTELFRQTVAEYGFRDVSAAVNNVLALSQETVSFLSPRRCRHFFAAVAPHVLREVAATPDSDATLSRLVDVTDSIGAKATLWELLRTNDATLQLTIGMCSLTPYLTAILVDHPGMIDELIDSLVMDRLPTSERIDAQSVRLCNGVEDINSVLKHLKASAHLMIGVRDLLGKESIDTISQSLSDTAESCLRRVIERETEKMSQRFGDPVDEHGNPVQLIPIALGKFAGREINYHSDLDLTFLYSAEGETQRRVGGPRSTLSNRQFFNQLAQNILRQIDHPPGGRLYELDLPFAGGADESVLAMSLANFSKPFRQRSASLWQSVMLCKARTISDSKSSRDASNAMLDEVIRSLTWRESMHAELRLWREKTESTAAPNNLKRGSGGLVDVELIAAAGVLRAAQNPDFKIHPSTVICLNELARVGVYDSADVQRLIANHIALRTIEAKLRLLNTAARHELPLVEGDEPDSLPMRQLAQLTNDSSPQALSQRCDAIRTENRDLLNRLVPSN